MTGKYYAILVNTGSRVAPWEAIKTAIEPDDWLRLRMDQWCVYSQRTAEELWKAVSAVLAAEDSLLVIEVVPANGWAHLTPIIHDWFKKPRT